jgi:hypothetical protein
VADQLIHGDSKEAIAYALLVGIAQKQGKLHGASGAAIVSADEQWVLDTYKKCRQAVEHWNE